ncbi:MULTISPECIES: hypothetical protein [Malaciobacter]|jgi:predicted membrane protein|uniref:CBU-0592-like domain-containing protein n=2 Tax=Malaciobacter TaxID=2321114 RepID=A0AB36ZYL2_9BACT|nr:MULTISPECIES: hypothetical protein [Malaciobacter]PHO10414.1 hypothetical protein CPG37_05015 [Malaciobacter canalis]PPK61955.1 hypothetical protein B0F89_10649 [Malaciobacter marinus]QEE32519.1 putative membrane protein [Malaciobacter canalis]SKB25834.1 hypothetical protein SAMN06295997_10244 [Malaciobacter marinus]
MDIFQWIGFVGMAFVVTGYLFLQLNKYDIHSIQYQLLNLVGAILLLISLCVHFNLGSFIIEVFWIAITIFGIFKNLRKRKNEKIDTFNP